MNQSKGMDMEGIVMSYVRSRKHQKMNHVIIEVKGFESRAKAATLVGKTVVWTSPARRIISGRVSMPHGNNGKVRAVFSRGLPGQCLGGKIEIKG
jgi:large subunit ribosomal protein L35Ae